MMELDDTNDVTLAATMPSNNITVNECVVAHIGAAFQPDAPILRLPTKRSIVQTA
jgi:hypothetical protein